MFPFNAKCAPIFQRPQLATRRHVAVVHFREPIGRWVSEYWYRGPGFAHRAASDNLWFSWINAPGNSNAACHFGGGLYFPNYYVQRLTAACGNCSPVRRPFLPNKRAASWLKGKPRAVGEYGPDRSWRARRLWLPRQGCHAKVHDRAAPRCAPRCTSCSIELSVRSGTALAGRANLDAAM